MEQTTPVKVRDVLTTNEIFTLLTQQRKMIDFQLTHLYKGRAKSSVTNRLPSFYPRYILKCFTALEWCVE